ncbi:acetyltransferase, CysE/LacA/LpxA/NodL family [Sporothrix schenckii 1099-18]|uniref:Maltose/galactoside acetyltransferase domain-containing protein n=2 Tax=Sporothrix schenckii TaxID=29908 RepID=U7PR58_SPOS1|nr:acetyltransferase, CysE/LacA/LpxA/NodL family [Sporothrix schenckii 1099-18]ERS97239.1 hypothetical protein HMPREF1624_06570 [Sporothrix schenckii ATCC 58251]KJR86467.1 acetyltransferase, CysE/LacA/LpxA/NodL family [Sporothrix schenckii 1099-18]
MAAPNNSAALPAKIPSTPDELAENRRRMLDGELYFAFTPDLTAQRRRCAQACHVFNQAPRDAPRRELVALWRKLNMDDRPLPPPADTPEADEALFQDDPWVEMPLRADYGYNIVLGTGVYVNANSTWIDTSPITVGDRTMIGPNCSFYSGGHPLDGAVRNGIKGPESGKPIVIGNDCWLGGNVTVVPGVTIGPGSTVGAGSVVTKDVPPRVVVAGNPARVIRKLD